MQTGSAILDSVRAGQEPLACWCSRGDYEVVFRTARFGLLRCRHCDSFQINPPAIRDETASGGFYSAYYEGQPAAADAVAAASSRRSRFWSAADRAPQLREVRQTVLDIGCGDGGLCVELLGHGWPDVIGIDVAHARVERARLACPSARFYCGALDTTDIARGSVDLMIMDNVIEHLPDPLSFVRNLIPWLKPGGRLVLITPNMASGNFTLLGRRWTPELAPHVHLFLFTPRSLARLLDASGLMVDATGTFPVASGYWRTSWSCLARGSWREAAWRAMQGAGELYGRLAGRGAMAFTSGRRAG
jgi:SAM-dependent methyltransferase